MRVSTNIRFAWGTFRRVRNGVDKNQDEVTSFSTLYIMHLECSVAFAASLCPNGVNIIASNEAPQVSGWAWRRLGISPFPIDDSRTCVDVRSRADMEHSEPSESQPAANLYHSSMCGSILYSPPTNDSAVIFSHLAHARLDAFHRALSAFPNEIPRMKNAYDQVHDTAAILISAFESLAL